MFAASSVRGRVLTLCCSLQKLLSVRKSEALEPLLSHLVEWAAFPQISVPQGERHGAVGVAGPPAAVGQLSHLQGVVTAPLLSLKWG